MPTHCSWPHPIDPGSLCLHHTSSYCGYTPRLHTGTHGCCSAAPASPAAVPHSSPATRQTRRHSPCLHRSARGSAHTPSCCTGRNEGCRWVWGRKPHQSHLNSRCRCRKRRWWIYTGHWRNETHQPCIVWPLWWDRRGVNVMLQLEIDQMGISHQKQHKSGVIYCYNNLIFAFKYQICNYYLKIRNVLVCLFYAATSEII